MKDKHLSFTFLIDKILQLEDDPMLNTFILTEYDMSCEIISDQNK